MRTDNKESRKLRAMAFRRRTIEEYRQFKKREDRMLAIGLLFIAAAATVAIISFFL